ncbi:MAG: LysR family transcriptional regulator, partial [Cryobacterium sp.]|nr:LysR family transcriptional regulator [Oligoflexia bacterium]
MNLFHLEQFYEVAKAGSVSLGAKRLRISQPAVSKSIRLLEEALGAKVFNRTARGVQLTPAGQIAFDHASRIFSEARALQDKIHGHRSELTGD